MEGSICPQINVKTREYEGDEDCLFLNVFTKKIIQPIIHLKNVMVWFHQGGFTIHSGNRENVAPDFFMEEDIIFVSVNYRLGVLGFLSLQTEEVPGNAGLKDQQLALHWVQRNIQVFGGDPAKVTIVGESSGSSSVHFHMLSPLSKELFHKAILESGTSLRAYCFQYPPNLRYLEIMGLNSSDLDAAYRKLMELTPLELVTPVPMPALVILKLTYVGAVGVLLFCPTLDLKSPPGKVFLSEEPLNLLNKGRFSKIPILIGSNNAEGILFANAIRNVLNNSAVEYFRRALPYDLNVKANTTTAKDICEKIEQFYLSSTTENNKLLGLIKYVTDVVYYIPTYCVLKIQSEHSKLPQFTYEFTVDGSKHIFSHERQGLPGAAHTDELKYLYAAEMKKDFDSDTVEYLISKRMVHMWANFIKLGNPTPREESQLANTEWIPFDSINYPVCVTIFSELISIDVPELFHSLLNTLYLFGAEFWVCPANLNPVILSAPVNGALKGTTLNSRNNKTFYAFMGIPYAEPPYPVYMFMQSPQAANVWEGVRDATKEGSVCVQFGFWSKETGDEDCLFLNVFTPQVSRRDLKPVMVWIHGGAFIMGSGNRNLAGPHYLIDEDVVVVTINYRLGAFGFLNLDIEEVPGNAGLKDQVLALKWVQENILEFGGNPNKVTIVGESAGGASVHLHILSPMSTGLFHHAISESGTGLNPWAFRTPNSSFPYDFGKQLGIDTEDKKEILEKIINITTQEILRVSREFLDLGNTLEFYNYLSPTLDSKAAPGDMFLPDTPLNLINSEIFNKVPYIAGTNSQEGIIIKKLIASNKTVQENIENLRLDDFGIGEDILSHNDVIRKIEDFYFDNSSEYIAKLQQYVDFTGDIYFYNGVHCTMQRQALYSKAPVFLYQFTYVGYMNTFKKLFGGTELPGAAHVDEVPYIYWSPNVTWIPESSELETSERVVRMWANFAKTGNPTPAPDSLLQNVTWAPVKRPQLSYLNIDTDLTMQQNKDEGVRSPGTRQFSM
ncbi:hypothetical protein L9F63_018190, partial [Diploptera punctata]